CIMTPTGRLRVIGFRQNLLLIRHKPPYLSSDVGDEFKLATWVRGVACHRIFVQLVQADHERHDRGSAYHCSYTRLGKPTCCASCQVISALRQIIRAHIVASVLSVMLIENAIYVVRSATVWTRRLTCWRGVPECATPP